MADIIALDICEDYHTTRYPGATPEDLAHTAELVENLDRHVVSVRCDVHDARALESAVDSGRATARGLDIVVANAGICVPQAWDQVTSEVWARHRRH